jgi:MOSC domain-containing protein YiiM
MTATILSVSRAGGHHFIKQAKPEICLIEGLGVEGDAHAGATVQHLSRIAKNPDQPNLRQVHLIHAELHDELNAAGFDIHPGDMGENILTRGLDLLALPQRTLLQIGAVAIVEVTGLRNPCSQLERFRPGLLKACLCRTPDGQLLRKAGIMAVVRRGGLVRPGDAIQSEHPQGPHLSLQPV